VKLRASLWVILALVAQAEMASAQFAEVWSVSGSLGTTSLAPNNLGDLDGDSQPELIANYWNGSTYAVQIRNPVTGAVKFTSTTTSCGVWDIYLVDLNNDLLPDHILATASGVICSPTVMMIGNTGTVSAPGNGVQGMRETLLPARPNPFGGQVALSYTLASPGKAELEVFDVAGRMVRRLGGDRMEAGEHRVDWDGRDQSGRSLEAGMYFYRLNVDGRSTDARKAIRLGP
jgi:flagellar hook capping protein FlgD